MLHHISVNLFAILSVHYYYASGGAIINGSVQRFKNETTNCEELNKPDWNLMNLANVTLDKWPYKCIELHYGAEFVSKYILDLNMNMCKAAKRGYIGFLQYLSEKNGVDLGEICDVDGNTPIRLAYANAHFAIYQYIAFKFMSRQPHQQLLADAAYRNEFPQDKYHWYSNNSMADNFEQNQLYWAAWAGDLEVMKSLVEGEYYYVNSRDTELLLWSVMGGNVDLMKYLMRRNCLAPYVPRSSYQGDTALHFAALMGRLEVALDLTHRMGFDIDVRNIFDQTPSYYAAEKGHLLTLEHFIEHEHADHYVKDIEKKTLLHAAARGGHVAVVKYLIERRKMNIELKDGIQMTALQYAVIEGKFDVVKYLAGEKKANLHDVDNAGRNLLHLAVFSGNLLVMQYLVDDMKMVSSLGDRDHFNATVGMLALEKDRMEIFKFLFDRGCRWPQCR